MDLFKRIQDLSAIYDDDGPSSTVLESRPMFANGQLVRPSNDESRLGYKGDKVYSDNYRTIYDKKTKLYSKKVGRDKKLLTQNPGETKKQCFNRVSNYSAEKSAERTSKFTKEIVDARSKIDSWTSNWLNNNLKNYGVKDFDRMTKDMKKAKDTRTKQQKDSLVKLLQELIYKYNKDMTIHGHNEFANKACPSFNVRKEYANL